MAKKVRVTRTGTRRVALLCALIGFMSSCGMSQSVKVRQSLPDHEQSVEIEHKGQLQQLSLSFYSTPSVINPLAVK